MRTYQKRWLETVRDFIGLWDRFNALYLQGIALDEVTEEKEDEFLQFEGAVVEHLVKVAEVDKGRFDVHDRVMALIHDALSLRHIARQTEFQHRRLRQRWTEASEALSKLQGFCEEYSPKLDRRSRLESVRRVNPFWDPAGGGFRATLTKVALGPVTFFSGLRPGPDRKAKGFLFKSVLVPSLVVFLVLAIVHLGTLEERAYNFGKTTGLLPDSVGVVPWLIAHALVLLLVGIFALATSIVLMLLAVVHAGTLHVAAKLFGGREDLRMTHKIVVYGCAPFVALVTAPYAIVLQMIGVNKAQKVPRVLAVLAWLIGTALLAALVLGILFAVYHFTGQMPAPGQYVEVTSAEARTYEAHPFHPGRARAAGEAAAGQQFEYKGEARAKLHAGAETETFYRIVVEDKEVWLRRADGVLGEFRRARLVPFLIELTRDKVLSLVERLAHEIGAEAG